MRARIALTRSRSAFRYRLGLFGLLCLPHCAEFSCARCRASSRLAASTEPDARNAPDLAPQTRLRLTRSEIAIDNFCRHRHHDQSKNPAHHTTGSKLAPRQAVLKFNLDAIHYSIMQTDGVSPDDVSGCSLSFLTASAVLARSSFPSSVR